MLADDSFDVAVYYAKMAYKRRVSRGMWVADLQDESFRVFAGTDDGRVGGNAGPKGIFLGDGHVTKNPGSFIRPKNKNGFPMTLYIYGHGPHTRCSYGY